MYETSLSMTVAISTEETGLHVSLSHPTAETAPVAEFLTEGPVLERASVTHFWLELQPSAGADPALEAEAADEDDVDYFANPGLASPKLQGR